MQCPDCYDWFIWTRDSTSLPVPSAPRLSSPYSHWGTAEPSGSGLGMVAMKSLKFTSVGTGNTRVVGNRDAWGWADENRANSHAYICIRQCEAPLALLAAALVLVLVPAVAVP